MNNLSTNKFVFLVMLFVSIIFFSACTKNDTPSETPPVVTTEEVATDEVTTEEVSSIYFEESNDSENLIALRELDASEYPKPFGTSEGQLEMYRKSDFYEVLILTPDKRETSVMIIPVYQPSHISDVYKKLSIKYEADYAIFKFNRHYFVVNLIGEPHAYKTPVPFSEVVVKDATSPLNTLYIAESKYSKIFFNTVEKRFENSKESVFEFWSDSYDWSSKTIIHLPENSKVVPITKKLTDDPDLLKIALGESTSQLFDALGTPISKGWILGDYLAYKNMMIYTIVDEKTKQMTLAPISLINYYGDAAVGGIKKGMTFKEVEAVIGTINQLIFTEGAENYYPLAIQHEIDNFLLQIDFNKDLKVNDITIRILPDTSATDSNANEDNQANDNSEYFNEYFQSILDASKVTAASLVKDGALMSHVDTVSYAHDIYHAVYFTIEEKEDTASDVAVGLYLYDMTTRLPVRISNQPMAVVFEIAEELNPSVIALGLEDGILYKIDLNRLIMTAVSGPNYKLHVPIYGTITLTTEDKHD